MIDFLLSAWLDFSHVMWLMRLGFIVVGVLVVMFLLFGLYIELLRRNW